MFEWVMEKYQRGKAELFGLIGSLFGLRGKIMDQRDRARRLAERARATGDPLLVQAARSLLGQVDQLAREQAAAEQKVVDAQGKIKAIESSKDEGLGFLPIAALIAAGAVVVGAVSAAYYVMKKYDYLNRLLDGLEQKILTPEQYREAVGGAGPGPLGQVGELVKWGAIGLGLYVAYQAFFKGGRARRA